MSIHGLPLIERTVPALSMKRSRGLVNVEVREVAVPHEREVALIGVEEQCSEVFLRFFDGFNVAAHDPVVFLVGRGVPAISFPIAKVYHKLSVAST